MNMRIWSPDLFSIWAIFFSSLWFDFETSRWNLLHFVRTSYSRFPFSVAYCSCNLFCVSVFEFSFANIYSITIHIINLLYRSMIFCAYMWSADGSQISLETPACGSVFFHSSHWFSLWAGWHLYEGPQDVEYFLTHKLRLLNANRRLVLKVHDRNIRIGHCYPVIHLQHFALQFWAFGLYLDWITYSTIYFQFYALHLERLNFKLTMNSLFLISRAPSKAFRFCTSEVSEHLPIGISLIHLKWNSFVDTTRRSNLGLRDYAYH